MKKFVIVLILCLVSIIKSFGQSPILDVELGPNPSAGEVIVHLSLSDPESDTINNLEDFVINIYSLLGQQIRQIKVYSCPTCIGAGTLIDIKDLSNGIYIFSIIYDNKNIYNIKVVKQE
jgi:hypothetical protein